jgi:hypothetical protein
LKVSDSADNSRIIYELPLLDIKVGVWYAAYTKIIIEPIFFSDIINSEIYSVQILASGFVTLCDVETECEFFQQKSAAALNALYTITALRDSSRAQ